MKLCISIAVLLCTWVALVSAKPTSSSSQRSLNPAASASSSGDLDTAATGYRRGYGRHARESRHYDYDNDYADEYDDEYERRPARRSRRARRRGGRGGQGQQTIGGDEGGNGGFGNFEFPSAAFGAGFGGAISGPGQAQGFGAGFSQSFGRNAQASGFGGGIARSSGRGYDDDDDR